VEKGGTGIWWYRRHCFRSAPFSFLLFRPCSPPPLPRRRRRRCHPATPAVPVDPPAWRAAPVENYSPLQRGGGACHSGYFFISPLFLLPRSSTHRLQYYHLNPPPPFQASAARPFFCPACLSPFFRSDRPTPPPRPLIYTRTSDHNINFNDGRDENIRTPRYLWRLSRCHRLHPPRVTSASRSSPCPPIRFPDGVSSLRNRTNRSGIVSCEKRNFIRNFIFILPLCQLLSPTFRSFRLCSCTRASLSRSTQHGSATRCARLMTFIRELVSIPPPAAPPGMVKQLTAPASARRCFLLDDAGRFVRQPIKRERHRGFFAPLASGRGNQRRRRLAGWQRGSATTSPSHPPSSPWWIRSSCFLPSLLSLADDHRSFFPLPS